MLNRLVAAVLAVGVAFGLLLPTPALAQSGSAPSSPPAWVADWANILDTSDELALTGTLRDYAARTGHEIVSWRTCRDIRSKHGVNPLGTPGASAAPATMTGF